VDYIDSIQRIDAIMYYGLSAGAAVHHG